MAELTTSPEEESGSIAQPQHHKKCGEVWRKAAANSPEAPGADKRNVRMAGGRKHCDCIAKRNSVWTSVE